MFVLGAVLLLLVAPGLLIAFVVRKIRKKETSPIGKLAIASAVVGFVLMTIGARDGGEKDAQEHQGAATQPEAKVGEPAAAPARPTPSVPETPRAETMLVRVHVLAPLRKARWEQKDGDQADPRGKIRFGKITRRLPKQENSPTFEVEFESIALADGVEVEVVLEEADAMGDDPIGKGVGIFAGGEPLVVFAEQAIVEILPKTASSQLPMESFPARAARAVVESELANVKGYVAAKDWEKAIGAAPFATGYRKMAREHHESGAVEVGKLTREARMAVWQDSLIDRGAPFGKVKARFKSAKVLDKVVNRRQDPVFYEKKVLQPEDGGYYVVISMQETNVSNEIAMASKASGLGTIKYTLVSAEGGIMPWDEEVALYVTRPKVKDGDYADMFDVRTGQTWKFRLFFRIPATVAKSDLYLEAAEDDGPVVRLKVF